MFKNDAAGAKTTMHYLHKGSTTNSWKQTKKMAKELNKAGLDVAFLPEYDNMTSADAITIFKGKYAIVDFKYSSTRNGHTLYKDLAKGFSQSGTIVLKLEKGDLSTFKDAVSELLRKKDKLGNIKIMDKYGRYRDIAERDLHNSKYIRKLRGFF